MSPESKAWMRSLPRTSRFELAGRSFFLAIHGGVEQVNRFLFASTATADFSRRMIPAS